MRLTAELVTGATSVGYRFWNDAGWDGARVTSGISEIATTGMFVAPSATRPGTATGVYWDCAEGATANEDFATRDAADALATVAAAVPTATQNADALLNRDMSAVSDTNDRSPLNALRFLRNLWSIAGSVLTVKKEDDSTTAWTATLSTDASAAPVVGSDPT